VHGRAGSRGCGVQRLAPSWRRAGACARCRAGSRYGDAEALAEALADVLSARRRRRARLRRSANVSKLTSALDRARSAQRPVRGIGRDGERKRRGRAFGGGTGKQRTRETIEGDPRTWLGATPGSAAPRACRAAGTAHVRPHVLLAASSDWAHAQVSRSRRAGYMGALLGCHSPRAGAWYLRRSAPLAGISQAAGSADSRLDWCPVLSTLFARRTSTKRWPRSTASSGALLLGCVRADPDANALADTTASAGPVGGSA